MPVDLDAERAWGCATGTLRKETAPINVTVATRPGLGSESTRTVTTCDTHFAGGNAAPSRTSLGKQF
jgi:hypothetical protein